MERRGALKTSDPDKKFRELVVGQKIPVTGSLSYWRNRQQLFHKKYPEAWLRIANENGAYFATRIK